MSTLSEFLVIFTWCKILSLLRYRSAGHSIWKWNLWNCKLLVPVRHSISWVETKMRNFVHFHGTVIRQKLFKENVNKKLSKSCLKHRQIFPKNLSNEQKILRKHGCFPTATSAKISQHLFLHLKFGHNQCCGSGIRCLFDCWIRDRDGLKIKIRSPDPNPRWTSRIMFSERFETLFGLKYLNSLMRMWMRMWIRIRDPGIFLTLDPGMNIPDPQHWWQS